jgi:medium-chain acyl-[acyl-carrier-protein] hydrolase
MFNPDTRYTKDFVVTSFDVDAKKKASLQSISRYMQEMATLHAAKLKLGFQDMIKQNRAWVLAQMIIRIDRLPEIHERFSIKTWSNGPDGRFALRDFEIIDSNNQVIGGASSTWIVIDITEKKICRLDEYFTGYKYEDIVFALGRKPQRIKPFTETESIHDIQVNYSDLDINAHVNNVRYIDFILDMFTEDFRMSHDIYEIEMNFHKEAKLGDMLSGRLIHGTEENEYLHTLINEKAGKPSFSARTQWR